MSTLPGLASKGEKGKSKFQSLDINSLYKVHTNEPSETQQQKNTIPRKHGMQILGKVPTARRPPANLPSLKSEHTGSDAAVSLVPSGGAGWGKQDPNAPPTNTVASSTSTVTNTNTINAIPANVQLNTQPVGASPITSVPVPQINKNHIAPIATPVTADKSWSAVMSGTDLLQPPPYQSPQFQHEFPSLSAGDGGPAARTGSDTQYGPGPSLRPQTEGSWIQGGARPGLEMPPRSSSAPLGPPPQPLAPAGQNQQPMPPQFRGLIPQFMCRGNFSPNGHGGPNFSNIPSGNNNGNRNRGADNRALARTTDVDDVCHRPIIKEEELIRMDDMTRDVGWASHDDIDYNQKLAFSDDDLEMYKRNKMSAINSHDKSDVELHLKNWNSKSGSNSQLTNTSQGNKNRSNDEDEVWTQRRRMQSEEVAQVIERAKQRKEEEEKRFLESKQAAAKKLQQLEEKINKSKHEKEIEDTQGTINPSVVPIQPITPVPIPVPDWEREKDGGRARTPVESCAGKGQYRETNSDFRKMSQIEGRSFNRKETRTGNSERENRERGETREQSGHSFSKQFQSNLPPRFQKQQQLRNNANVQPQGGTSFADQYDVRWQQNQSFNKHSNVRKQSRQEVDDSDHKEQDEDHKDKRNSVNDGNDFYHRSGSYAFQEALSKSDNRDHRSHDSEYSRNDEKWEKDCKSEKKDLFHEQHSGNRYLNEDKLQDRFERPQRPDSRDSRASRESRHSRDSVRDVENREYNGSWADTPFEAGYDDRRREHTREDRRAVPGPITRDRIEAEDLKSEKKNLTQLKKGYAPDKKIIDIKKDEHEINEKNNEEEWNDSKMKDDRNSDEIGKSKAWADALSPNTIAVENSHFMETFDKDNKYDEMDIKKNDKEIRSDKDKNDKKNLASSRQRGGDARQLNWPAGGSARSNESGYVYRSSWTKKSGESTRRGTRSTSKKAKEWQHGTDSDGSLEEIMPNDLNKETKSHSNVSAKNAANKKLEKEEKNKETKSLEKSTTGDRKTESTRRENYVPRGEPSRHGRGGGNNFRSNRGGLSNRVERFDVYGPPSSKSPFSQHDDKDKKQIHDDSISIGDDKMKSNLQSTTVGNIASSDKESDFGKKLDEKVKVQGVQQRSKKGKDDEFPVNSNEHCDTSDNSDENGLKDSKSGRKFSTKLNALQGGLQKPVNSSANRRGSNNPPPRFANEKRSSNGNYTRTESSSKQMVSTAGKIPYKKEGNKTEEVVGQTLPSDKANKKVEEVEVNLDTELEEKPVNSIGDVDDGFQEVKSKKTGQRQKSFEDKPTTKVGIKLEKDNKLSKSRNGNSQQLTPQQIANIPSLMDTPVNPPPLVPRSSTKGQFDRNRQNVLPPRLAKQRENHRLQKVQMQHGICETSDSNKVNMNVYSLKDGSTSISGRISNAWEKPLGTHIRSEQENVLNVGMDNTKPLDQSQQTSSQSNSPNIEKIIKPSSHISEKPVLDGTTPPVNTIIFENTNFKSAPGSRPNRTDKSCTNKLEDTNIESSVISTFNKPMRDLLSKNDKQSDSIQMQLNFNKEDSADMKLDFFESEISHLTEEKGSKNISLSRSIHSITNTNTAISASTADALNFKIASVKKVWETMPTVIEQDDSNNSFSTSFGPDPNSLDPSSAFGKNGDNPEDTHEGYSSSPNQTTSNNTTNVCKVKPTQQVAGTTGQTIHASAHQHSSVVGPGIVGHPLSPPLQPVIGAGVGLGQPQGYTSNQHLGYQPSLGGSSQYGMSAIPSPPTVLFNSNPQIQAQSGLYGTFQIDQSVLGGQGRSQYSQYPNPYGLSQTASSPYSQSMYLQGTQPHPPTAQAPPDIYQNLNSYRLSTTGPFGQSQQLSNPTTVLISSTSNSLMSATVKPSTQQISAIGTKANGAGQAYQQQSQQQQQLFMAYDPSLQANYLPNTGVMQRGPTAPIQNNVVPTLQPSSSYYTGSAGGQTGYFQQPGSSTLSSAQLQHQAGYGLQGNVFGNPNQSHTTASFGSHFLSNQIQIAAAINAQQFRSNSLQNSPYVKGISNHVGDQNSRPQQIKSPGSQQDVLSSVFNSGPQISSPKSRPNLKQPPPQPSPTTQHKYNAYQSVGNQAASQTQRYPTPIQRPPVGSFQSTGRTNSGNSTNSKHQSANQTNKLTPRNYYPSQGGNITPNVQNDKIDDGKLGESATSPNSSNSTAAVNKTISTGNSNQVTEVTKDTANDEANIIKE